MKAKAEQCKEEGNKCLKEGKNTEAILHYTEAIKYEPSAAALYSNRSLAFLKIDQLYLAMEDALKAIKLEPSWPKGFFRKGEIEFKAGSYTKALMSYRQAQLLDPTDEGIIAAISKTNKEFSKDRKDAARKPIMYTSIGVALGLMVVLADQFLTDKPSIPYMILQVLLIALFGGIGFGIAKIYRYITVTQRESLLEEPLDLLKELGDDSSENSSSTPASHKHHGQAAGRQRMKKGKS